MSERSSVVASRVPRDDKRDDRAVGTQAIRRALAVLELFRDTRTDLGNTQIANALGLRPSTTHRIVRALVDEGYLTQNAENERYYLSRGAVLLGLAAQRSLGLSAALPVLERISASTSESVNLGVSDGTHALVVLRAESPLPLRFDQPPGTRVPLHASSMGKALLAFGGDVEEYVESLGGGLPSYTPHTVTSVPALRKEIEVTRDRGYSLDDEESITGVRCVGAPIINAQGRARAAAAIQAPSVRLPDARIDKLAEEIVTAAAEISDLLPPDHEF
ncbi:MAG: IclR family transcriptional regulator [Carbonactinosporaceae bacterium]